MTTPRRVHHFWCAVDPAVEPRVSAVCFWCGAQRRLVAGEVRYRALGVTVWGAGRPLCQRNHAPSSKSKT